MPDTHPYDVVIAYRIYPGVSKTPFIFQNDKLMLTEVGVRTLQQSLGGMHAKIFFLLDNCPPDYKSMIQKYFPDEDIVFLDYPGIGNLATFKKQVELLLEQNFSEVVMFAEDDYVYRTGELRKAIQILKNNQQMGFVTPYDHLDSYLLPIHTKHRYKIISGEGLHWRTSASTCLTFLTSKEILQKTRKTFLTYSNGNWDSSLWFSITGFNIFSLSALGYLFSDQFLFKIIAKSWLYSPLQNLLGKKYSLWQPMPSIATHMEKISLAPNVDWNRVVDESNQARL
ncbi:MAG TPA: hypothetical protein VG737_06305 [Cyclobacteriaceae bacterium]|nr:hypothetical protein [Cyclobacteriaceae bacterium]